MPSDQRCRGEHAYPPAEIVLIYLGHGGGVVAADEAIRALLRVDRRGDDYLVPASVVGSLQGDDLRTIQSPEGVEPEPRRTVDVVRGILAALRAEQRVGQEPRRQLHSFAPVVVYSADPSR